MVQSNSFELGVAEEGNAAKGSSMKYILFTLVMFTTACSCNRTPEEQPKIHFEKSASQLLKESTFFQAVADSKFGIGAPSALGLINGEGQILWVWYDNIVLKNTEPNGFSISTSTRFGPSEATKVLPNTELSKYLKKALSCAIRVNKRLMNDKKEFDQGYLFELSNSLNYILVQAEVAGHAWGSLEKQ